MKSTTAHDREAGMLVTRRGFSLLELLVVVAIMAILAAVAVPAVKALTQNNNQKQARNMVSAYIASARATALQQRRFAGVVFFEDPSNKNQVAVRLIRETSTSGNLVFFLGPFPAAVRSICRAEFAWACWMTTPILYGRSNTTRVNGRG